MIVLYHKDCLLHSPGAFHPERKERIIPLVEALEKLEYVQFLEPQPIEEDLIKEVHSPSYIENFKNSIGKSSFFFTTDCPLSKDTYKAALLSASGAILGAEILMKGEKKGVFSLLRPPGHHARKMEAMGFCYFNNAALAAQYLLSRWQLERIGIIDWDAHHGNGTQEIFYETDKVFYTSLHGHPLITYPGTGFPEEKGRGEGEGYTLNFPFFPETTDEDYLRTFKEKLIPALERYRPQFLIISCGFDGHSEDPLVPNLKLSDLLFENLFEETLKFAKDFCGGKALFLLEGGYNPEVVKRLGIKLVEKIQES
ncbi:MAG: histone deacetylase [Thermoanaerobaculia bacterium]